MDQIKASRMKHQEELDEKARLSSEAASHFSGAEYAEFLDAHVGKRLRLGNSTSFLFERDPDAAGVFFLLYHENPPAWVNEKYPHQYDSGRYKLSRGEMIHFIQQMKGCVDMMEYFEKKELEASRVDATQEIDIQGFGDW